MKFILSFLLGGLFVCLGLLQAGWIFYNLFIETLPEAQGRNPKPAISFAAFLVLLGIGVIRESYKIKDRKSKS